MMLKDNIVIAMFTFITLLTAVVKCDVDPCDELYSKHRSAHFDATDYGKYCVLRCETIDLIKCHTANTGDGFGIEIIDDILLWIKNQVRQWGVIIRERRVEDLVLEDLIPTFDPHYAYDLMTLLLPLVFLVVLCVTICNTTDKFIHITVSGLLCLYVVITQPRGVTVPYVMLTLVLSVTNTRSAVIPLFLQSVFVTLTLGVTSLIWQSFEVGLACVVVFLVSFGLLMRHLWFTKHSNDVAIIGMLIALSVMCAPLFMTIIDVRGKRSLFGQVIIVFARISIPVGEHNMILLNNWINIAAFVKVLENYGVKVNDDTVGLMIILSLFVFVGIRGLLGWYVVYHGRKKFDVYLFLGGLYVYAIDGFYGPFHFVAAVANKRWNAKVVGYFTLNLVLTYVEWQYAKDILFLRIFIGLADAVIFKTGMNHYTRYLSVDVDLSGIAFPKLRSMPWASTSLIADIGLNVVELTTKAGKRGVGFIRRDARGMKAVHTVDHVILGEEDVLVNGVSQSVYHVEKLGASSDPVVTFDYDGKVEGVEISCLTVNDLSDVKTLMVSNNGVFAMISDFHFDVPKGSVFASVDVKQGDSGSPVFAIMKDGRMRLCGAVSRGTFAQGAGNMISCVFGFKTGSPGIVGHYEDVVVNSATQQVAFVKATELLARNAKHELPESKNGIRRFKEKKALERATLQGIMSVVTDEQVVANALKHFDEGTVVSWNSLRQSNVMSGWKRSSECLA